MTPGERLRAELKRLGLDQVAATKALGYSRQSINNVVNDRQKISRAMAAKLGRLTGHSSDFWLRNSFPGKRNANIAGHSQACGLLDKFELLRVVKDGVISIDPFLEANVGAAYLELTLGEIASGLAKKQQIATAKGCTLRPGTSAKLLTKERIKLPRDYIGRVSASEKSGSIGLVIPASFFITSAFSGAVEFWALNISSNDVILRKGDRIASLEIIRI